MSSDRPRRLFQVRRLPARYGAVLTPFVLSIVMSFIVSGISTVKSIGLGDAFWRRWAEAWAVSWMVAFPTLLVILLVVRRIVAALVEPPPTATGR